MNAVRVLPAALALAALAILPVGATAASLVPPGNSAANQYTETFPTTGGNAEAKGKGKVTAGDVLGGRNAKKLDSQGRHGREAAAVVAATAPPPVASVGGEEEGGSGKVGSAGDGAPGVDGGVQNGGGQAANAGDGAPAAATGPDRAAAVSAESSGSSGLGEVLGQATGSTSSGGTGLLLPLVVLASVIWALALFLRRRRRTA